MLTAIILGQGLPWQQACESTLKRSTREGDCALSFFLLKRGVRHFIFHAVPSSDATPLLAQLHRAAPLLLGVVVFDGTTYVGPGGGGPSLIGTS